MTRQKTTIRPAVPTDFEAICRLAEQMDSLFRENLPERFRRPRGPVRRRDRTVALMSDPDTFLYVAEQGGRVVGIVNAGFRTMPDHPQKRPIRSVVVRGVVVRRERRRQGIGSRLLAGVRRWARKRGADEIQASVYDFDPVALAFFGHAGMTMLSHRLVLPLAPSRPRFMRRT